MSYLKDPHTFSLFPTPLYRSIIDRPLTEAETKFIEKNRTKILKNEGNWRSEDEYVLDNIEMSDIKKELEIAIKNYSVKIAGYQQGMELYITQSWLNYTNKDEFHHMHHHSNSIISGVFYINADINVDTITFFKYTDFPIIKIESNQDNEFNTEAINFRVDTGMLFLFPSTLIHKVNNKIGDNLRISLSFNTFVKGTIGKNLGKLSL